jgi:hypothetical protein
VSDLVRLLGLAGLTLILVQGHAFRRARGLFAPEGCVGFLVRCAMCLGMWVGAGAAVLGYAHPLVARVLDVLEWGGAVSLVAYVTGLWTHLVNPPLDEPGPKDP